MRRTELIEGVKTIMSAIERNGVQKAFRSMFEGRRSEKDEKETRSSSAVIVALNGYAIDASKFNEAEKKISSIMGIDVLTDAARWMDLSERTPLSHEIFFNLDKASSFLTVFMGLIEQDYVEAMKHDLGKVPAAFQGKALLSVIILVLLC
jgi:hypothetical protein